MMRVCIQLFARAKDLAGASCVEVEVEEGCNVGELRRRLARQCPALEGLLARSALAMDEEFAEDQAVIRPGVKLALLPPVSGGQ